MAPCAWTKQILRSDERSGLERPGAGSVRSSRSERVRDRETTYTASYPRPVGNPGGEGDFTVSYPRPRDGGVGVTVSWGS